MRIYGSTHEECAHAARRVLEVDGRELPDKVQRGAADAERPVDRALVRLDAGVHERRDERGAEQRDDGLDVVAEQDRERADARLDVVLAVLARVDRVVEDRPAACASAACMPPKRTELTRGCRR
jgi:hypothetical protein